MAKAPRIYRRLPGRGSAVVYYVRFYEGPDHFLQVQSTGFTEAYKRFYFRDIQAFIVERKPWHQLWSVFWLFLAGCFVISALSIVTGAMVLWSIAAFFVGIFLVNLFIGPSCACYVQTAVQTEKLPTLKRVRSARKFIRRIHPALTAAQTSATTSVAETAEAPAQPATPETASPGA
jgi:hypothetical protein